MKRYLLMFLFSICSTIFLFAQTEFWDEYFENPNNNGLQRITSAQGVTSTIRRSKDGKDFPTKGTYRVLTIFINIIYDSIYSAYNPGITNNWWPINNIEGVNSLDLTSYFNDIFDVNDLKPRSGYFTRFMSDCSFDSLVLISDFTSVEINASRINSASGGGFESIANATLKYINDKGGLQTKNGHNSILDYDKTSGVNKTPNSKIDYIVFLVRNPSKGLHGFTYGTGYGGVVPSEKLKMSNGQTYNAENGTVFGVGHYNLKHEPMILIHEFAHGLLGNNSFHTSGGNHYGTSNIKTFIGHQNGYGLFGGGLRSTNGFERWRLGWQSPSNIPYSIAATGVNSEISQKFTGTQTYYLRDFITYGDALRIKLPYKDNTASSNQYIWLENHQIGQNQKTDVDVFQYSTFPGVTCIPKGSPGVYSYIQVGKDIIENSDPYLVYPPNETDNLRMINAEGNYNMTYWGLYNDCIGWGGRKTFEYQTANTLSGSNDQTEVMNYNTANSKIQNFSDFSYMGSKLKNGVQYNKFPSGGDDLDCFTNGQIMDISSNPTPINATTYYSYYYYNGTVPYYAKVDNNRDTRKKYLTGLNIKMTEDGTNEYGKIFKVEIRWDDYDVKQNVNWAGDVVLKEQLNLLHGKTITLEQNKTVNQIEKDPVSNFFAKTTFLTCEGSSVFNMATNSSVFLKENSSLVLNNSSTLTVQDGGTISVESGSTLQIKTGANINLIGSAKIVIKTGGYICVELGANINLQNYQSLIVLEEGAVIGANPLLFSYPNCASSITKTINSLGSIADFNQDIYIQNTTISASHYYGGKNIYVGNHVTTSQTGDVIINNGANVIFDCKEITFDAGFECAGGSTYEVKNH